MIFWIVVLCSLPASLVLLCLYMKKRYDDYVKLAKELRWHVERGKPIVLNFTTTKLNVGGSRKLASGWKIIEEKGINTIGLDGSFKKNKGKVK